MKKALMAIVVVVALVSVVVSQTAPATPKKLLTEADVKKFAKDYPTVGKELDALDIDFADEEQGGMMSASALRAMFDKVKADARVVEILKKYGWDDTFFEKFYVIVLGYTVMMIDESLAQITGAIQSDTSIPEDQKSEQLKQTEPMIAQARQISDDYRKAIHPDDLALLIKNRATLDGVLNSEMAE